MSDYIKKTETPKYLMLACAVLARECYSCAALSNNIVDVKIIEQGLHDVGEEKMSAALQSEIDATDTREYDAILLGYGLCNNGIRNLSAPVPLVIPRAHDCITLLLGSKNRYQTYFTENPGTFFHSVGWVERAKDNLSNPESTTRQMGFTNENQDYIAMYGEENAAYLQEILGNHLRNYSKLAYINTNVPNSDAIKKISEQWAQQQNWQFCEVEGNTRLLSMAMKGNWPDTEFLVIEPGMTIEPSYDDRIIKTSLKK